MILDTAFRLSTARTQTCWPYYSRPACRSLVKSQAWPPRARRYRLETGAAGKTARRPEAISGLTLTSLAIMSSKTSKDLHYKKSREL